MIGHRCTLRVLMFRLSVVAVLAALSTAARADVAAASFNGIVGFASQTREDAPASVQTTYNFESGSGDFKVKQHAEVSAASYPTAFSGGVGLIQATVRLSGNSGMEASAAAYLSYAIFVNVIDPPPFMPDTVPVNLDYIIAGAAQPGAGASAALQLGGADFPLPPLGPEISIEDRIKVDIQPGGFLSIVKSVGCYAAIATSANVDAITSSGCNIAMDPRASFDQARFDSTWGAASFGLTSYFALAPSAPVDEPATIVLLLVGMLAVFRRAHFSASHG